MNTPTEPSWRSSAKPLKFTLLSPLSLPADPNPGAGKREAPKTRILIAEDDPISREIICARLVRWGYDVIATKDGTEAMTELRKKDAPTLAILDWMMPGMDGVEICRRTRTVDRLLYVIMLTARDTKENLIEGLSAGADDYLVKPFDKDELHARILVGVRIMALQTALAERLKELEAAAEEIGALRSQIML